MSPYITGVFFAVVTALSWAVLAIALKVALHHADAQTIAWFRMISAFFMVGFYFAIKKPKNFKILRELPIVGIIAGLFLAFNYWGFMQGIHLTTASQAQIMIQLGPLALAMVGILYFKETPNFYQAVGFVVSGMGLFLFYLDQSHIYIESSDKFIAGTLWLIGAALTWTIYATLQKKLALKWSPQQINLLLYLVAGLALWPVPTPEVMLNWSWPVWLLMLACGLNTVVAYGSFAEALHRIPASHVSLIITANPLLTLTLIALLTHWGISWQTPEPIGNEGYVGAFLVVVGLALVLSTQRKKAQPQLVVAE